jgi:hypothetical protein
MTAVAVKPTTEPDTYGPDGKPTGASGSLLR